MTPASSSGSSVSSAFGSERILKRVLAICLGPFVKAVVAGISRRAWREIQICARSISRSHYPPSAPAGKGVRADQPDSPRPFRLWADRSQDILFENTAVLWDHQFQDGPRKDLPSFRGQALHCAHDHSSRTARVHA